MKKIAAAIITLLLLFSLTACGKQSLDDLCAPIPGEFTNAELILQAVESAPSNALAIVYGDEFMDMDTFTETTRFSLSASNTASELMIVAIADNTSVWVTGEDDETLWADTLDCGESVILRADIPTEGGFRLWMSLDENDNYYQELNEKTLDLSGWIYIIE